MEKTLEFKKRKGFTVLEESIVIAIIALLAIPLVTLLNESIRAQVYGTKDVKGQYNTNLIMQDFERRVRQANEILIPDPDALNTPTPECKFTYRKSNSDGTYSGTTMQYDYKLDNSIFYRNDKKFPVGLEKGIITNFSVTLKYDSESDGYYLDVVVGSANTILQKTIYLVNYYEQE